MIIRDAIPADFSSILALNHESEHFLSPLDSARLCHLHGESAYHRVVESATGPLGFLLAFAQGADYDSANYQWFSDRFERFLYIDRVVVSAAAQTKGLGRALYENVFAFAGSQGCLRITCEFDLDPPNPVSAEFHRRFGFVECGRQQVANGSKQVSMQVCEIAQNPFAGDRTA